MACATPRGTSADAPPGGLASRVEDYARATDQAHAWLDALDFDPVHLHRIGIASKKTYAEILDAYRRLLRRTNEDEKAAIETRLAELVAHARRLEYHDLEASDEEQFAQDSMSYLRVLTLLEGLGEETGDYRSRVAAIQPRLDAHLTRRGPWQRAMFAQYYDRLGLTKPALLQDIGMQGGVVARRLAVEQYDPPESSGAAHQDSYDLTHEVFVAHEFGESKTPHHFTAEDLAYIRATLPHLVTRYVVEDDPDLVAELLLCMTMTGQRDDPKYAEGVAFLLDTQNEDGSWGNYESLRSMWRQYLEHRIYLHTTYVALWALQEAFEPNAQ